MSSREYRRLKWKLMRIELRRKLWLRIRQWRKGHRTRTEQMEFRL
jgi:hypothetical protein